MIRRSLLLLSFLSMFSFGCDQLDGVLPGSDDDDDDGPSGPAETVEDTLTRLGVDISTTPRQSALGTALPDTYTPIGATAEFSRVDELFTLGIEYSGQASFAQLVEKETGTTSFMNSPPSTAPWIDGKGVDQTFTQSPRTAVAADVDADGREEIVIVYVDLDDPMHDEELVYVVKQDELHTTPFEESAPVVLLLQAGIVDVTAAAGDWNGDGRDEIAVGYATADVAELLFTTNASGELTVEETATESFTPVNTGAPLSIALEAAQLDYDGGQELAIVVNEHIDSDPDSGLATYYLYDDATADHEELDTDDISGNDGGVYTAVVADVAAGDVDGDGLDEVIFGGFDGFQMDCVDYDYILVVLDDKEHQFASMGADHRAKTPDQCSDVAPFRLRWVHVNALDTDGDRVAEFHMNEFVYDSFVDDAPFTLIDELGAGDVFYSENENSGMYYDRSTSAVAVGDLNMDGKQDLLVYGQGNGDNGISSGIFVFGENQLGEFVQHTTHKIGTTTRSETTEGPDVPLIVPVNVDDDTIVVKVAEPTTTSGVPGGGGAGLPGSYKLVFSEPIIHAVLAAPPCADGIGQNTDSCVTTYGTAVSGTTTTEQVLSVSASVSVGVNVDGGALTQSEISLKGTLSTTASAMTGDSYSLTQHVVYTTGPLEDSVIFTTVPYDTWTYEVVSHPTDPALVGQLIPISIPREPITLIAEREFFNSTLRPGELQIGSNVFQHTPGVIESYPTLAQKNTILGQHGGLATPVQSVGQGTSSTEIGLAVGTEHSEGGSLEVGYEFELEATVATVMVGFSVGASVENSFSITSGTETSYTGAIGSLDSEHFAENLYSFGLFTYVMPLEGREIEVVNYWVE